MHRAPRTMLLVLYAGNAHISMYLKTAAKSESYSFDSMGNRSVQKKCSSTRAHWWIMTISWRSRSSSVQMKFANLPVPYKDSLEVFAIDPFI